MRPAPFEFAERLDRSLGDPNDPAGVFSYRRTLELDQHEEFPRDICALLDSLGLARYYVPAPHGGDLVDYTDLMMLGRMLSRRDFTVALAHAKTYLGAACAWTGSRREQAERLAAKVLDGQVVCLALTEEAHGADLLKGEVSAQPRGRGFRLNGEKWLINNATRGQVVCLLARTDPAGGPRGFSLLLIDKRELATESWRPLPPVRTHGVRGADISGIRFADAEVARDALVGEAGTGLETVLKSMQLTRTLCAGLSLGMADHALRVTMDFATQHRLYNRVLTDLPLAARTLATAYADLLLCEAVTLVAMRSVHCLTAEMSVVSAIVKYLVPTIIDGTITNLSGVLGARALLTQHFADGRFQKVQRDHQIVGIFDGSTHVNLAALINQLPSLARGFRRGEVDEAGLAAAATLAAPVPELERNRLTLLSRRGCSLVQDLPGRVAEVARLARHGEVREEVAERAEELLSVARRLHDDLAGWRPSARDVPPADFDLARRYARCYAGAACLELWLRNRDNGGLWEDGVWLGACLARLLSPPCAVAREADGAAIGLLVPHLLSQHANGQLFSLLQCRLVGEQRQVSAGRELVDAR